MRSTSDVGLEALVSDGDASAVAVMVGALGVGAVAVAIVNRWGETKTQEWARIRAERIWDAKHGHLKVEVAPPPPPPVPRAPRPAPPPPPPPAPIPESRSMGEGFLDPYVERARMGKLTRKQIADMRQQVGCRATELIQSTPHGGKMRGTLWVNFPGYAEKSKCGDDVVASGTCAQLDQVETRLRREFPYLLTWTTKE